MGVAERWRGLPPLPPDIATRLARLSRLFDERGVRLAYLFGTLARGEAADDVDLALLVGEGSAHDLWPELAAVLGTDRLDLVDLAVAPPVLRFMIVAQGRVLYRADQEADNAFELAAIREYRDTRHHRQVHDAYVTEWAYR